VVIAAFCGLVFIEPDFGTAILIGLVSFAVLMIAGSKVVAGGLVCSSVVPVIGLMVWLSPARWRRIIAFLDPDEHSSERPTR